MKHVFSLILAIVAAVAYAAPQAWARGGGGHGGGGHHGGGHHGGGHHGGHHAAHHGEHHASHHDHHHSRIHTHYHHNNRPFTRDWHGHHPNAWNYNHANYNPWGYATLGAAGAWLGLSAYDNAYPVADNTTVYTGDVTADDSQPTTNVAGNDQSQQQTQAAALANTGAPDPGNDASYLPLGVFSLAPEGQVEASAMVQLAVSKDGVLRGTYYDLLSDQDQPIRGAVDKKTQRVAWNIGTESKTVFETSLKNLTQEEGDVSVHFPNGEARTWSLGRYEEDSQDTDEEAEEPAAEAKP